MKTNQQIEKGCEAAGASDEGQVRTSNEDTYGLLVEPEGQAGNFVVCDGMGGAAAGEVASRMTVEIMLREMRQGQLTAEVLQQAVSAANDSVHRSAQADPALAGMGTTLVALALRGPQAWVVNVGDSRCYRLRDGRMECLTQDHSLVDEQVRLGHLTPEEAQASPLRNIITRAVGTQDQVSADVSEIDVRAEDLYMLASDGLMREVDDQRIAEILSAAGPLEEACVQLIEAANQAGGEDNITCVLARTR